MYHTNNISKYLNTPHYYNFTLFAVKVGLASAAVYYVKEEGIWRSSNESEIIYQKLKQTASPYVDQATAQLPFELPTLPESNVVSSSIKETWNKGVTVSFKFLSDLPDTACKWTSKGIEAIKQNEEIKKMLNDRPNEKLK